MTCPSCDAELDPSQLSCPSCGQVPAAPGQPETELTGADLPAAPEPHQAPPPSPWADTSADWPSPAPSSTVPPSTVPPAEVDPTSHTIPLPQVEGVEVTEPLEVAMASVAAGAPEPTLAFGSPQQYLQAAGTPSLTPPGGAWTPPAPAWDPAAGAAEAANPAPPARKRRLVPILLLTLALVVVGGGVATAGYFLGWFGAGKRPSDVIPGSAVSFVQLDLNPSLVQKAAAWQFLRDLPQVKEAVASGQPDPKKVIWKLLGTLDGNPMGDIDYDTDVKPWLGDQFAVGVLPKDKTATPVFAVQVTDEAKAAATLRDWASRTPEGYDVTMKDGYALLTRTGDTSLVTTALAAGNLSSNPEFAADFASLGDPGVLSGWGDVAGLAALSDTASTTSGAARGRGVFSLTFTQDTLTLGGKAFGLDGTGLTGSTDLGALPATTWAAVGFSGGGTALRQAYPELEPLVGSWLQTFGLEQDDLVALLGTSFSLGAASTGGDPSLTAMPELGARIVTGDTARAEAALDKVLAGFQSTALTINHTVAPDGAVVVATSDGYLAELATPSAPLSSLEQFTKALPNHARATASSYVYLKPLLTDPSWADVEYGDFLKALRSFGAEYVATDTESGTWSLRLVRG
ncbi:MAG: DUF3352 domain-containing protein [Actinobacteria bacterium]|nr:DUF3352 domain-containing protein [Actinomycetota bacterium]